MGKLIPCNTDTFSPEPPKTARRLKISSLYSNQQWSHQMEVGRKMRVLERYLPLSVMYLKKTEV